MRRNQTWAVGLLATAALTAALTAAVGAGRLVGAEGALPGTEAPPALVEAIHARQSIYRCGIADCNNKCSGNVLESVACVRAGGGTGVGCATTGAACGSCQGGAQNTCSGSPLMDPMRCFETTIDCCDVTSWCQPYGYFECYCAVGGPAQSIGLRFACWHDGWSPGYNPPPPEDIIIYDCLD